ncbi:hypothetical protein F0L74_27085 [Chitinophaga agrisoli]|uniref:Uncharacterized protein n=1 Tax=Chitinophaga agrisoli TaxID=2607653 RepID=A0A5B2VLW6_9BACT|nr:hypothetical protein [Chitinophaga agrisoli]KAA2239854.1 hypothetical protein F0L74_27085 [Chitinophaga agrisoli]
MITVKQALYILLAVPFIQGCYITTPKKRVIILSDVSNSVLLTGSPNKESGKLIKLKEYVKEIPGYFPPGSELFYYPVSNNLVSPQLGEEIALRAQRRSELTAQRNRIDTETTKICVAIDDLAQRDPSSCILLSVKRAIERFNELGKNQTGEYSNELVIISDMIECCKVPASGKINMSVTDPAQLRNALSLFDKVNIGELDASNLGLRVTVLVNSPWAGVLYSDIKDAWRKKFIDIGIKPDSISFATDLRSAIGKRS